MSIEDTNLTSQATRLYLKSLLLTLPISLLMVATYQAIHFGLHIGLLILYIPLLGAMIILLHHRLTQQPIAFKNFAALLFRKFISLLGCFLFMAIFPGLLVVAGFIIYMVISKFFSPLPTYFLFVYTCLILTLSFLAFVSKIMAPILIFTDNKESNSAIELSEQRVKGHFGRTLIYSAFGFLLLVLIAKLPEWYMQGLFVLVIPWVVSLWLVLSFKS